MSLTPPKTSLFPVVCRNSAYRWCEHWGKRKFLSPLVSCTPSCQTLGICSVPEFKKGMINTRSGTHFPLLITPLGVKLTISLQTGALLLTCNDGYMALVAWSKSMVLKWRCLRQSVIYFRVVSLWLFHWSVWCQPFNHSAKCIGKKCQTHCGFS